MEGKKDIGARALIVRMGNVIWVKVRGGQPLRAAVSARNESVGERQGSLDSDHQPDRIPPTTDQH